MQPVQGQQVTQHPYGVAQGTPLYKDSSDPAVKQRIITQGYQDIWAALLFIIQVIAAFAVMIYNLSQNNINPETVFGDYNLTSQSARTLVALAPRVAYIFAAVIFAIFATILMRVCTRPYIWIMNILAICLLIAQAAAAFARKEWFAAVILAVFAVLTILWLWCVHKRIPFAAAHLKQATIVIFRYWGVYVVTVVAVFVLWAYSIVWFLMAYPAYQNYRDRITGKSSIEARYVVASVFFLLMMLWTSQVIANTSHVTTAGSVATWFFFWSSPGMPANPTPPSLKRALTTSFGSICFGSLIIAILKFIYYTVRALASQCDSFLACVLVCLLGCIVNLMEYFNIYALTHVAIYGSSFITAAKQTWNMIKQNGFSAMINDSLVYPVLSLTSLICALTIAVIAGFVYATGLDNESFDWPEFVTAFILAYTTLIICFRPVFSALVSLNVLVAEAPDVLRQNHPEFSAEIDEAMKIMSQNKGCGATC